MPKAFDEKERQTIRSQLMAAGLKRFAKEGVRSVRVEDICRDAGIAKGSFYAFFPSKEELFMTIVDEREVRHKADMLAFAETAEGSQLERGARFFDMLLAKIETDPVLGLILAHGELAYLMRKLGPERMQQAQDSDRAFVEEVASRWVGRPLDPAALLGLMTLMLSLAMSRNAMTEAQYRSTAALLRELFVGRLVGDAR